MDQKQIERLSQQLASSDAIVIGAGAGLSTSAGFTYTGERFEHYFPDFIAKYHFSDMYSGGFYPLIRWKNIGLIESIHFLQSLSGCPEAGLSRTVVFGAG